MPGVCNCNRVVSEHHNLLNGLPELNPVVCALSSNSLRHSKVDDPQHDVGEGKPHEVAEQDVGRGLGEGARFWA